MRVAIINLAAGQVQRVLIMDAAIVPPDFDAGFIAVVSAVANVGDGWDGANIIPAPPVITTPVSVTHRQFFQQLAIQGVIPSSEAIAAVRNGNPPAIIQNFLSNLSSAPQFAAIMSIAGNPSFGRRDALVTQLGNSLGFSSGQLDQFFINAASL